MPVFAGNTSSTATSTAYIEECKVISFTIVNKTGAAATLAIDIINGGDVLVSPYNLSMSDGDTFYSDDIFFLPAGYQIQLTTDGTIDYFFSLE